MWECYWLSFQKHCTEGEIAAKLFPVSFPFTLLFSPLWLSGSMCVTGPCKGCVFPLGAVLLCLPYPENNPEPPSDSWALLCWAAKDSLVWAQKMSTQFWSYIACVFFALSRVKGWERKLSCGLWVEVMVCLFLYSQLALERLFATNEKYSSLPILNWGISYRYLLKAVINKTPKSFPVMSKFDMYICLNVVHKDFTFGLECLL